MSQFTIVKCDELQTRQTRVNSHAHWAKPVGITLEQWLTGYDRLCKTKAWSDDRLATWALVPRSDPHTLDMLAHCETHQRFSLVAPPGSNMAQETTSYGVACVHCPPQHAGHSYAKHLMKLLHYVLAPSGSLPPFPPSWGSPPVVEGFADASFSVLFSAIGDQYYYKCSKGEGKNQEPGWVPHSPPARRWNIQACEPVTLDDTWEWVEAEQIHLLEDEASRLIRESVEASLPSHETLFAVLPKEDVMYLDALRYQLIALAHPDAPDSRYYGIINRSSNDGQAPFMTFSFINSSNGDRTLVLTFVNHPLPFNVVVAVAQRAQCTNIEMWGEVPDWDNEGGGVVVGAIKSKPCVAVYGLGQDPSVKVIEMNPFAKC